MIDACVNCLWMLFARANEREVWINQFNLKNAFSSKVQRAKQFGEKGIIVIYVSTWKNKENDTNCIH